MPKRVRVTVLLAILVVAALTQWRAAVRVTDWEEPLWVVVHPIDGDGRAATRRHLHGLDDGVFEGVEAFLAREAARYGVRLETPVDVTLGPALEPPPPARPPGAGPLRSIWWSLRVRYWAYRTDPFEGVSPDVRIYVIYYDPAVRERVPHSSGLRKGLIGIVNAFASRAAAGSNNVVIAHELMHTLGASDKYDPATGRPRHPEGFAAPRRRPLYPQSRAEIMGGRIPLSPARAVIPRSLASSVVGPVTAREINWTDEP
ncbi:MAG: hypothetical protein GWO02_07415 [Gammaproteobacteria bacterium]|nr:hypothetical protein [Gammaproteobacteria bacterium]